MDAAFAADAIVILRPKTRVIIFDKLSEFAAATRTLWD
jgi:hypothetical protein